MKFRKFYVKWRDVFYNKDLDPPDAVRVEIYMPKEIADYYRSSIWGIEEWVKTYNKNKEEKK